MSVMPSHNSSLNLPFMALPSGTARHYRALAACTLRRMERDRSPDGQRSSADDAAAALAERLFQDVVGALELFTVYLGERLSLYRALDAHGPATSLELAGRTSTTERDVREWLEHHAASGLLEGDEPAADPPDRPDRLPPAHPPVLAGPHDAPYPAVPRGQV